MKYFVIIILLLIFPVSAKAGIHVGISVIDARLHSPNYKVVKGSEPSMSYNIGYSKEFTNKWITDLTTNIFVSKIIDKHERTIITSSGATLLTKSRSTYVSYSVGRRFNRLVISLPISYVEVTQETYLGKKKNHSIIYGGHLNYFVTKRTSGSFFCSLPSSHIDLKFSCGGGMNYYF